VVAIVEGEEVGPDDEQVVRRLDRPEARARTRIASEPSNTSIAVPIADSIWMTSGELGSAGSTFLRLTMIGRPRTPCLAVMRSRRTSRSTHRLLALKVLWRLMSRK